MQRQSLHKTWLAMRSRCSNNTKNPNYIRYAGRGISVCRRWNDTSRRPRQGKGGSAPTIGFLNFLEDMGPTWFEGATIDRIDNDGDYTPENCQWLTAEENSRKRIKDSGNPENNRERVDAGTHHFIGPSINKKRISEGTHNFLGSDNNKRRLLEGIHPSQNKIICGYCSKNISKANYARWHGMMCKHYREGMNV